MANKLQVIEEKAKYAATLEKEFKKSVNLSSDEIIEYKKRGIVFTGKYILQSPGFVVLTNKRIIFLMHHLFGPDKLLYIPLNAISGMNLKALGFLRADQMAISLDYDNTTIIFAITQDQNIMSGIVGPEETMDFFEFVKEKITPSKR